MSSRRPEQDRYLHDARTAGLPALLSGVLKIAAASQHKHKYCRLLRLLQQHGLVALPSTLDDALRSPHYNSAVNACLPHVTITASNPQIDVLYLRPAASRPDEIGFTELATWLDDQPGPLPARFAASLRKWVTVHPGR